MDGLIPACSIDFSKLGCAPLPAAPDSTHVVLIDEVQKVPRS
jgi:hypothetical protein